MRLAATVAKAISPGVEDVVTSGLCVGCGLCASQFGPRHIEMSATRDGFERPRVIEPLSPDQERDFRQICPGIHVEGPIREALPSEDAVWGPILDMAEFHAADPGLRFAGASSGSLSTLALHLIESGEVDFVAHLVMSATEPLKSQVQVSQTRDDIDAATGSRYAPTVLLQNLHELLDRDRPFAIVGKPCDITALTNLASIDPRVDRLVRYRLSFFCGGVSPLTMPRAFLERQGVDEAELASFRWRGMGCPGPTTAVTRDGRAESSSYLDYWGDDEESWGIAFRCKICPDSIASRADIALGDAWHGGNPSGETDGVSMLVARTSRGRALVQSAVSAGLLVRGRELTREDLEDYQPHHAVRRRAAAARQVGLFLASGMRIRTRRLRLLPAARGASLASSIQMVRGAVRRARAGREGMPVQQADQAL